MREVENQLEAGHFENEMCRLILKLDGLKEKKLEYDRLEKTRVQRGNER